MAPRGGRGGGGGGGSRSSGPTCPGAFSDTPSQVVLAENILFLVVFSVIALVASGVRKKGGAGIKLLGWPFLVSLFFLILANGLEMLASILYECSTIDSTSTLSFYIATNVFWYLASWGLLFVFVYTLNTMLREQLGGVKAMFKLIYMVILGVMFGLTCGAMGLTCYNIWSQIQRSYYSYENGLLVQSLQLKVAYGVLFLLSVLASSVLAMMTVFSLRSRQHPTGDLIGWVGALIFAMVLWAVISLVFYATSLEGNFLLFVASSALSYIEIFFEALSFIFLICIAKHAGWSKSAAAPTEIYAPAMEQQQPVYVPNHAPQQQYAYNHPNGQQNYNQQPPVFYGNPGQVR